MTRLGLATWVALVAAVTAPAATRAEDAAAVEKRIDATLTQLVQQIDGIPAGGGSGFTRNAAATVAALDKLYDQLADADGATKDRGVRGLKQIGRARDALAALERVKQRQDAATGLAGACAKADQQLRTTITTYEATPEARNVKLLADLAAKLGGAVGPKLADADRRRVELVEALADISVPSDGDLRPALNAIRDAAAAGKGAFAQEFQHAQEACGDLARGKEAPLVIAATKRMTAAVAKRDDTLDGIEAEYASYKKMVAGLRQPYSQDLERVVRAMCQADEVGDTDKLLTAPVETVINRAQQRLLAQLKDLQAEEARLAAALKKLVVPAGSDDAKRAKKLSDGLAASQRSIANAVKTKALVRGTNDPAIRARLAQGQAMHKKYQDSQCDVAEVTVGSVRLDCIKRCDVIEIKPNTSSAIGRGKGQVDKQRQALIKAWDDAKKASKPDAARKQFMRDYPTIAACIKNDVLVLTARVATYDYCPRNVEELEFGDEFVVP